MAWFERKHTLVARERLLEALEREQGISSVVDSRDIAAVDHHGPVEGCDRVLVALEILEDETAIGKRFGRAAVGADGGFHVAERLVVVAALTIEQSELVQ